MCIHVDKLTVKTPCPEGDVGRDPCKKEKAIGGWAQMLIISQLVEMGGDPKDRGMLVSEGQDSYYLSKGLLGVLL